jgi:glucose/arabinose dehydrogenase
MTRHAFPPAGRAAALVTVAVAALTGLARPVAAALPPNFFDQLVATVGAPTALAFTPDGRLLITTQGGALRVYQAGSLLATPALTIPGAQICTNSERGLLGVAVHPQFATNNYIYLYYTANIAGVGCKNRVSRFTLPASNVINPASELVLIDRIYSTAGNHNGGDLKFGQDGYLYVSVGDGGCDYASPFGCAGDNFASRSRNVLIGKILRITADGQIPAGNPFQGAGTARCNVTGDTTAGTICQETFAWGLRNPFRAAFDQNAAGTRFFINDVGQGAWEEIDLGQAGVDYGWNCREGAHTNRTTGPCSPTPPGMVDPIFEYQHGVTIPGTTTGGGCGAITGGAFVPNGLWPGYDGTYLFSDYNCGWVVRLSAAGPPYTAADFATNLGGSSLVTMLFGPNGGSQALYYTTYAAGGQVRRIYYNNSPPVPVITLPLPADTFRVGQVVNLTGSATDPEDGVLPPSRLSWTVLLHHLAHTHPFIGPVTGSPVPITCPAPEDLLATDSSYLEIRLTATDLDGLAATVVQNFQPLKVPITIQTVPSGLVIPVNGINETAPVTFTSWADYILNVDAPNQGLAGTNYTWMSWSDGGARAHAITTPAAPATYTATFQALPQLVLDYFPVTPCRLVDTRSPAGPRGGPALQANAGRDFDLDGVCGVPTTAKALAVNVTVTGATGSGDLRVWETGLLMPGTSVINFRAARARANNAVVTLSATGSISVYCDMASSGSVHFILDVVGYFQ